jgi:hypothetical protein
MGATNPDPVGELAGGAAAFIPQQMVVGPAEGKILDVADQWLGKKGASDVARFIFKEGAAGSTVASAGEARALSNEEETPLVRQLQVQRWCWCCNGSHEGVNRLGGDL